MLRLARRRLQYGAHTVPSCRVNGSLEVLAADGSGGVGGWKPSAPRQLGLPDSSLQPTGLPWDPAPRLACSTPRAWRTQGLLRAVVFG